MTICRLLVDEPRNGAWNMAADEFLLQAAGPNDPPTLRLYRWSEPTLSLGYFQHYDSRQQHAASLDCACVRRHSGGGAIIHDRELTYSLIVPDAARWGPKAAELYQHIHGELVRLYREWGAMAELSTEKHDKAFLCFQRRAIGDILVGAAKVTGSAQRRHRGVTLQHGSILLKRSPAAPELDGMEDLLGKTLAIEQVIQACIKTLSSAVSAEFLESDYHASERSGIKALAVERFARAEWTKRR